EVDHGDVVLRLHLDRHLHLRRYQQVLAGVADPDRRALVALQDNLPPRGIRVRLPFGGAERHTERAGGGEREATGGAGGIAARLEGHALRATVLRSYGEGAARERPVGGYLEGDARVLQRVDALLADGFRGRGST